MARNMNGKGVSLKDQLFNKERVEYLSECFIVVYPPFLKEDFMRDVLQELHLKELKQRIVLIAESLEKQLPQDFEAACKIIIQALPGECDPTLSDNDFGSFIFAPLGEYVVRNGLSLELLPVSLATLKAITTRFSMEDAIRYFINAFETETLIELSKWVDESHYHVRRLVSEGTRPLLPWSGRIGLSNERAILFLDILHSDSTRYVTRSVANHLNDISKKNPALVVSTLARWHTQGAQDSVELAWMTRHALRTLVKKGDNGALTLLGYSCVPKIVVTEFMVHRASQKITPGESLSFSCTISAEQDEKLIVDYRIDFVKANGETKPKVFKIKKCLLKKGESLRIQKTHRLLAEATTFRLYPGTHTVALQINGVQSERVQFEVT